MATTGSLFLMLIVYVDVVTSNTSTECPTTLTLYAERSPNYLTSPNHPGYYGDRLLGTRMSCSWLIQANSSYTDVVIQLHIHNSSLEYSTACVRDYVTIINGPKDFHRPLKTWCGTSVPFTITATGDKVLVLFGTDFDNNDYSGFFLAYWVAKRPKLSVRHQPWTMINYVLMALSAVIIVGLVGSFFGIYYLQRKRPTYRNKQQRPGIESKSPTV